MKTSKIKKGQQGFTLVEVIVVAIIVAALAAVAVPMYTSYVKSSQTNSAANTAGSVAAFMGVCLNLGGTITNAINVNGTAPTEITCVTPAPAPEIDPKMQLPKGIRIKITVPGGTGEVIASHVDGGDTATYKY